MPVSFWLLRFGFICVYLRLSAVNIVFDLHEQMNYV